MRSNPRNRHGTGFRFASPRNFLNYVSRERVTQGAGGFLFYMACASTLSSLLPSRMVRKGKKRSSAKHFPYCWEPIPTMFSPITINKIRPVPGSRKVTLVLALTFELIPRIPRFRKHPQLSPPLPSLIPTLLLKVFYPSTMFENDTSSEDWESSVSSTSSSTDRLALAPQTGGG